jgi:S1-C subfamily serine protease
VGREEQLRRAVVRILDRGLKVVGTGFFVTGDLIATCAHVVHESLQEKDKALRIEGGETVEIQLLAGMREGQDFVSATVEGEYFRDKDAEDVAFLRLKSPLPDGIQPLALATSDGMDERDLRGFAFPKVGRDGLWMTATVIGPLDRRGAGRRLQLRSSNISPGCSGGPLWNERGHVVGMAVAIVDQEAQTGRHGDTAKAIAAEVLARVCRELSLERVESSSTPPPPKSPAPKSYDRFELCDALCRMMPVQFDMTLFRTGASPAQLSPASAPLATRALDLVLHMEQRGAGGIDELAHAIKKVAPHLLP